MTPARLGRILGAAPAPQGSWTREAVLVSAVPLRIAAERGPHPGAAVAPRPAPTAAEVAGEIAARLRGEEGIAEVRVRPDGFLAVVLATPGEIAGEIVTRGPRAAGAPASPPLSPASWPDFPRTWDNPGFAVRYAYVRAVATGRWAAALGVPGNPFAAVAASRVPGDAFDPAALAFDPATLDGPYDRAVLRALAELPSRTAGRNPAWAVYAERLALAYHDAFEHAPALPAGDRPVRDVHTARLWLARAVRDVLAALAGPGLPDRL